MEAKEFFLKARQICLENVCTDCEECILYDYCVSGVFGNNEEEIDELMEIVKQA